MRLTPLSAAAHLERPFLFETPISQQANVMSFAARTLVPVGHRIDSAIGQTPMAKLERVVEPGMAEVWVKLEA